VVIPPFQANDEHGHFVRAYEISRGHLLGKSLPSLPVSVIGLLARYPERLEDTGGAGKLIREDLARAPGSSEEIPLPDSGPTHKYLKWGIIGANLYCPVAYLPAAAGVWLGRSVSSSALSLIYAARLSNVIVFALALALAFQLAPECRALLGALAMLPMTLEQVSVVSADAAVISAAFLGFAAILRTRRKPASRKLMVGIAILLPLWAVCKPSPWTFGTTFLIGGVWFTSWRSRMLYVAAILGAMLAASIWWQVLSSPNTQALRESRRMNGIDIDANVAYATRHPGEFGLTIAFAAVKNLPEYARQFWGVFGWSKFSGPWWLRVSFLAFLIAVAATEELTIPFSVAERWLAAAVCLSGFLFVHAVIFLTDAHACEGVRFCFDNSAGVQGRYFIPFSLFGLVLLKQERIRIAQRTLLVSVASFGMVQGVISLATIAKRFYS